MNTLIHELIEENNRLTKRKKYLRDQQRLGIESGWQKVKALPDGDKRKQFILKSRERYEQEYGEPLDLE